MRHISLEKITIDIHSVKSAKLEGKFLDIRYKDNEVDKCEYDSEEELLRNYNKLNDCLQKAGKVSAKIL